MSRADLVNAEPFKPESRSPLRDLHFADDPAYIRVDPAHTYAIEGIGKDFLASSIVLLVRMDHFGSGAYARSFQTGYASFLSFCSEFQKTTSITDFGSGTLKLKTNSPPDKI